MLSQIIAAPSGRREARRHSRREAILDEAQCLFLEQGYAATTMSAIAARLGGSKGTLWHHFANKEVLFEAMVERATDAFQARASQILVPGDSVRNSLQHFAVQFIERVTAPDAIALHRLVVGEARRFPETGRIFHERASGRMREILSLHLAEAMSRGQLRRDDPAAASRQFVGLCLAGCHQQLTLALIPSTNPVLVARDAELAVDTFMRAYAPPPGPDQL